MIDPTFEALTIPLGSAQACTSDVVKTTRGGGLGLRHQRSKEEGEEYWGEALTWKLDRDQLKQGGYRRRGERVLVTVLCSSHRRHLHPSIQPDLITWFLP